MCSKIVIRKEDCMQFMNEAQAKKRFTSSNQKYWSNFIEKMENISVGWCKYTSQ